jgi:hypothetical protein
MRKKPSREFQRIFQIEEIEYIKTGSDTKHNVFGKCKSVDLTGIWSSKWLREQEAVAK